MSEGENRPRVAGAARERILAAAVRRIASEGIDGVRIARIAMDAGVSTSLVHYHFSGRDALLAEALDWSYTHAGDARIAGREPVAASSDASASSHAGRLASMIGQCLPSSPSLQEDWVLWVELWLRAVRHPELRPVAEELYARLHAWFAREISAGVAAGEFARCDPHEVADRTLIGDSTIPLERARRTVQAALARDLGLGEALVASAGAVPGFEAVQASRRTGT